MVGADEGDRSAHYSDVDATPTATSFSSAYPSAFPSAFSSIQTPASAYAQAHGADYSPWSYQARRLLLNYADLRSPRIQLSSSGTHPRSRKFTPRSPMSPSSACPCRRRPCARRSRPSRRSRALSRSSRPCRLSRLSMRWPRPHIRPTDPTTSTKAARTTRTSRSSGGRVALRMRRSCRTGRRAATAFGVRSRPPRRGRRGRPAASATSASCAQSTAAIGPLRGASTWRAMSRRRTRSRSLSFVHGTAARVHRYCCRALLTSAAFSRRHDNLRHLASVHYASPAEISAAKVAQPSSSPAPSVAAPQAPTHALSLPASVSASPAESPLPAFAGFGFDSVVSEANVIPFQFFHG